MVKSPPVMKYLFSICLLLTLAGCNEAPKTPEKPEVKKGKYFFDFDEVIYYKTNISDNDVMDIFTKHQKSKNERLLLDVVAQYMPESLNDTLFISKLEEIGYGKRNLPKSSNVALNEIFSQKEYKEYDRASCQPFYRDIYVFKKKGKTVGVAKICYGCGTSIFTGAQVNTNSFGANGELGKLEKIVK